MAHATRRVYEEPDQVVLVKRVPRCTKKELQRFLELHGPQNGVIESIQMRDNGEATIVYSNPTAAKAACASLSRAWFCQHQLILTQYSHLAAEELRRLGLGWLPKQPLPATPLVVRPHLVYVATILSQDTVSQLATEPGAAEAPASAEDALASGGEAQGFDNVTMVEAEEVNRDDGEETETQTASSSASRGSPNNKDVSVWSVPSVCEEVRPQFQTHVGRETDASTRAAHLETAAMSAMPERLWPLKKWQDDPGSTHLAWKLPSETASKLATIIKQREVALHLLAKKQHPEKRPAHLDLRQGCVARPEADEFLAEVLKLQTELQRELLAPCSFSARKHELAEGVLEQDQALQDPHAWHLDPKAKPQEAQEAAMRDELHTKAYRRGHGIGPVMELLCSMLAQGYEGLRVVKYLMEVQDVKVKAQTLARALKLLGGTSNGTESHLLCWTFRHWHMILSESRMRRAQEDRDCDDSRWRTIVASKDSLIAGLRHDLHLKEAQVSDQAKTLEEAQAAIAELETERQRLVQLKEDFEQHLRAAEERLNMIQKEMGERLLCPLSFKPMREPVIGTDLRTYQKDAIEEALKTKPASPFTRLPMESGFLRPNMLATDFLDLMRKHFPDWEADIQVQAPAQLPPVGLDLLRAALRARNSDQAVELLGRDVDWEVLNGTHTIRSVQMTILHVSISQHLPKVACAIINRPDFRRMETLSSQGIAPIHMAAAFNFGDVCRAILRDVGKQALSARTLRDSRLDDPNGRSILVPRGSTAFECARLFGHNPDWIDPAKS